MKTLTVLDRLIRKYRHNSKWVSIFKLAKEFIHTHNVVPLQQYLCDTGSNIVVDGILGKNTINNMLGREYEDLSSLYHTLPKGPTDANSILKTKILNYLADAEGRHLHWNATERGFTTMYGIYSKKHKRSKPIQYIRRRAKELGFRSITRRNIRRLDKALTAKDRTILTNLIYDFYVKTMFLTDIIPLVSTATYLTYFSLAVHGGKARGVKALKSSLHLPLTKRWTADDTYELNTTGMSDIDINNGMLVYMQSYYDYLIRNNPAKYGIYARGWTNRLKKLRRVAEYV